MLVRSGLPLSVPILFSVGHPDGGVTWQLIDSLGLLIDEGTAAVAADDVSIFLTMPGTSNALAPTQLFDSRDLVWSYTVNGQAISGELRYSIEARAPYGVSTDGVRSKLGVEKKDLPDADIALIRAYVGFRSAVTPELLTEAAKEDATLLSIRDAIEASAALALIPTMAVRVAVQEDSGTNSYKRQSIDWGAIATSLEGIISDGYLAVNPQYDPTPTGLLFILAPPAVDAITGA